MTNPSDRTPVTDVHAHLLLPAMHAEVERRAPDLVAEAADLERRRNGIESLKASGAMVGARIPQLTDVARAARRRWTRRASTGSGSACRRITSIPWAPEGLAVWVAGETNRLVAEHVAQAPDRLTGSRCRAVAASRAHRGVPRRRRARARARGRRDLVVRRGCRAVRRRASSRSGRGRPSSAASCSCIRSAAASTSGSTASTSRTPSGSRPRTRSRCRT